MADRNPEPKEGFFDHGLNFFKRRSQSSGGAARARAEGNADPYGHVGSGKKEKAQKRRISSLDPLEELREESDELETGSEELGANDPLGEAYALIQAHGGVRFGAQREDGSWEVFPPSPLQKPALPEVAPQAAEPQPSSAPEEAPEPAPEEAPEAQPESAPEQIEAPTQTAKAQPSRPPQRRQQPKRKSKKRR